MLTFVLLPPSSRCTIASKAQPQVKYALDHGWHNQSACLLLVVRRLVAQNAELKLLNPDSTHASARKWKHNLKPTTGSIMAGKFVNIAGKVYPLDQKKPVDRGRYCSCKTSRC